MNKEFYWDFDVFINCLDKWSEKWPAILTHKSRVLISQGYATLEVDSNVPRRTTVPLFKSGWCGFIEGVQIQYPNIGEINNFNYCLKNWRG